MGRAFCRLAIWRRIRALDSDASASVTLLVRAAFCTTMAGSTLDDAGAVRVRFGLAAYTFSFARMISAQAAKCVVS